jgi:outer membrane protein OmpA-like peptidoglycan-associated protein
VKAEAAPVREFQFDKMSVVLSESEKVKVLALVDQAVGAQAVVIRGHCDRTAVGNAKDAAVARAVAVQRVLRKAGVDAGKIRIRYNTSTPLHMAEVDFE